MEPCQSIAGGRRTSLKKLVLAVDEVAAISFKLASCRDGLFLQVVMGVKERLRGIGAHA